MPYNDTLNIHLLIYSILVLNFLISFELEGSEKSGFIAIPGCVRKKKVALHSVAAAKSVRWSNHDTDLTRLSPRSRGPHGLLGPKAK